MKSNKKKYSQLFFFALATVLLSSCNRGYGCPGSMNLDSFWSFLGF